MWVKKENNWIPATCVYAEVVNESYVIQSVWHKVRQASRNKMVIVENYNGISQNPTGCQSIS